MDHIIVVLMNIQMEMFVEILWQVTDTTVYNHRKGRKKILSVGELPYSYLVMAAEI